MPPRIPKPQLPVPFVQKKQKILSQLAIPASDYNDLSPKGSVDENIRDLIQEINGYDGWVTTSSCAGRVSVFIEGVKKGRRDIGAEIDHVDDEYGEAGEETDDERRLEGKIKVNKAGAGGKGGGGRWLFVSHEPVILEAGQKDPVSFLGMQKSEHAEGLISFAEERLIHFKFEPMILHILTASLAHAQSVLIAALQAGFRESGAINITSDTPDGPTPMVAVRSTGLALDSIIGRLTHSGESICVVSENYLQGLLAVANDRFKENTARIARFRSLLGSGNLYVSSVAAKKNPDGEDWEDASLRRERKKAAGLKRSQGLKQRQLVDLEQKPELYE